MSIIRALLPLLALALAACAHAPAAAPEEREPRAQAQPQPEPEPQQYAGYYTAAWEKQAFQPCGQREEWWTWNTHHITRTPAGAPGRYFVVLKGEVSARGQYGHLGMYPRQILVTEVLEVRPATGDECAAERTYEL